MAKCIQPDYVKDFKCNGKFCNARCCRDWRIVIDEKTYDKFLQLDKDAKEKIISNIKWMHDPTEDVEVMTIKMRDNGHCSFLTDDCLCSIQKIHGEDFLTAICQSFPRVTYKLDEEIFQQSMTLTCPVAAEMILLSDEPIKFVEVDNVTARAILTLDENAPRNVEIFLKLQADAIKILQDRNLTINQRLKNFYELFGGKISEDVKFNLEKHSLTIVDIFNKMYKAGMNDSKKNDLSNNYTVYREIILTPIYENFSYIFENYLVNEFFMRCYPHACRGGELHNCKVFITGYRLLEFALVLAVISKSRLTLEDTANLIVSVNDMIDHTHGSMEAIINFAKSCDDEIFAATMLDSSF